MGWVVTATSRPLHPREYPGAHCLGGWVAPGSVWMGAENIVPTWIRSPDCPVRLRCRGPLLLFFFISHLAVDTMRLSTRIELSFYHYHYSPLSGNNLSVKFSAICTLVGAIAKSVMSVCSSVRIEQIGSYGKDFSKICRENSNFS